MPLGLLCPFDGPSARAIVADPDGEAESQVGSERRGGQEQRGEEEQHQRGRQEQAFTRVISRVVDQIGRARTEEQDHRSCKDQSSSESDEDCGAIHEEGEASAFTAVRSPPKKLGVTETYTNESTGKVLSAANIARNV